MADKLQMLRSIPWKNEMLDLSVMIWWIERPPAFAVPEHPNLGLR